MTDRYAVVGRPIGHTKSPTILMAFADGVGVGMLVEQAAEAFAWWRGVRPDTAPMIARLTIPLS